MEDSRRHAGALSFGEDGGAVEGGFFGVILDPATSIRIRMLSNRR